MRQVMLPEMLLLYFKLIKRYLIGKYFTCALLSRISRPLRNLASGLARLKAMIRSITTVSWTQTGLHIRPKFHLYILQQEVHFKQEMTYFVYRSKNQHMPALSSQFYFSSITLCRIIDIDFLVT